MKDVRELQAATLTEADHPLWAPALNGAPGLADWPTAARVLFLDLPEDYVVSFDGHEIILWGVSDERRMEAFEALAADLFAMWSVNYHSMRALNQREFRQYIVAMLHAVQIRIPDPGEGPHIFTRVNTLDPEYCESMRQTMADPVRGRRAGRGTRTSRWYRIAPGQPRHQPVTPAPESARGMRSTR